MWTEEQEPLFSFTVAATVAGEWGKGVIEQILKRFDAAVPAERVDAFWVQVHFDQSEDVLDVVISDEDRFIKRVNKAMGQALLSWRLETVYSVKSAHEEKLAGVLLLMNTVSLQDIMSLGV